MTAVGFGSWSSATKVIELGNGTGKSVRLALLTLELLQTRMRLANDGKISLVSWSLDFDETSSLASGVERSASADRFDGYAVRIPEWFSFRAGDAARWPVADPIISRAAEAVTHRSVGDVLAALPVVPSVVDSAPARVHIAHPPRLVRDAVEALLRFLNGIVTALSLLLVLLLVALSRLINGVVFVLVVIAVCLRYGRRQDSPSRAFLLIRQFESSTGRTGNLPAGC